MKVGSVMVQEPRRDKPLYSCIVPVDSITGNQEEELTTFATSASAALSQAEQMLADNYGCNVDQIKKLYCERMRFRLFKK